MKVKAMGRKVQKSEDALRCFIKNPTPVVKQGYDPALRGMELTGPARPAVDVELSDHGCGLRLFECRKRCIREADRPVESDIYEEYQDGNFTHHSATLQHLHLLQKAGDACREGGHASSALAHYEKGLTLDSTDRCALRPRLVALLMDTGDAARARDLIPDETATAAHASSNVTYQWTLFLVEYISHFLLKEEGSSAAVVMRTLEKAMACNPHVGLFLSLSNVFEGGIL